MDKCEDCVCKELCAEMNISCEAVQSAKNKEQFFAATTTYLKSEGEQS